jgi:hypothetical protein
MYIGRQFHKTGPEVANKFLFKISTRSFVGELGPCLNVNEKNQSRYYIEDRKNNIRLGK